MKGCSELGLEQIFTSYNNPKGNADTERVIRTIKEDMVWVREWSEVSEFEEELKRWIERYPEWSGCRMLQNCRTRHNNDYPHSSLAYKTSAQFEQDWSLFSTKISA